jgi:hypothetical protein
MATGFPVKANYATGDILTATNMNDLAGTLNYAVNATPTTATQMAGKNAIINGDFGIWQRGTSFNASTTFYTADRWAAYSYSGASQTVSQQAFTAGTAPISGYEAQYFLRATATNTGINVEQRIEDVRTYAGQAVTLSFWAKSNSAQTITTYINQNFGSGGSTQVTGATGTQALTTSWTRFTLTGTLPSIAGKTIGTSSYLQVNFVGATINNAVDIWGVQLESGSSATPFQTATGTKQGELAACQRYFAKSYDQADAPAASVSAGAIYFYLGSSTTASIGSSPRFPVAMRTGPTVTIYSTTGTSGQFDGARAASVIVQGQTGFTGYYGGAVATTEIRAHYTANAEL